jgi:hypothetical protein
MSDLVRLFSENPLSALFGCIGFLCLIVWPLFHARAVILSLQFSGAIFYGLHYALLGAWTGASMTALGASQTLIAFLFAGHPRARYASLAFLPMVAGMTWLTWSGAASLCAGTALFLIMLGRMQMDEIKLRVLMLSAAPFGMSYDVIVGSLPGLAGACVAAAVSAYMLARTFCAREQLKAKWRRSLANNLYQRVKLGVRQLRGVGDAFAKAA